MKRFSEIATTALLGATVTALAAAQSSPVFDLADVRVSPQGVRTNSYGPTFRGGRYEARRVTMVSLIANAYSVPAATVLGGPSWLDFDRFDIVASAPPATDVATQRLMLQTLLVDRFGLVAKRSQVPQPQYALRADKARLRLKPSAGTDKNNCRASRVDGTVATRYQCVNVTMAQFTQRLRQLGSLDAPVVDATGLTGAWDFEFTVMPPSAQAAAGEGDTMVTAMNKLGLEVSRADVLGIALIVERVNQKPSDNRPGAAERLAAGAVKFEVASIRPAPSTSELPGGGITVQPGGQVIVRSSTLRGLIASAWNTRPASVVGTQRFLDTERFEIVANVPADVPRPVDAEAVGPMLKALLQDRFKLSAHEEDRPTDVYLLTQRPELRMQRGSDNERGSCKSTPEKIPPQSEVSAAVTCTNTTMAQFASALPGWAPNYVSKPVVDLSSLAGAWNFTFMWTGLAEINGRVNARQPGDKEAALAPVGAMTVFESLERLGIRLTEQKHPMPAVVVDHVEQTPIEN
jgi:uncharacterized protein (TIGR03435 family)